MYIKTNINDVNINELLNLTMEEAEELEFEKYKQFKYIEDILIDAISTKTKPHMIKAETLGDLVKICKKYYPSKK